MSVFMKDFLLCNTSNPSAVTCSGVANFAKTSVKFRSCTDGKDWSRYLMVSYLLPISLNVSEIIVKRKKSDLSPLPAVVF